MDAFDKLDQMFTVKSKLGADKIEHFSKFVVNEPRDAVSAFGHMRAEERALDCLQQALALVKKAMSTSSINDVLHPLLTHMEQATIEQLHVSLDINAALFGAITAGLRDDDR